MEISEMTLWLMRFGVLALMYLFLIGLVIAVIADARAASRDGAAPAPVPATTPAPAAVPTSRPSRLVVVHGTTPAAGSDFRLAGPLEIGRAGDCDICLPVRFVSSHHARVAPQGTDWVVEDLGSTNGTLVNGAPLTAPHTLALGDRITVGDTELEVR